MRDASAMTLVAALLLVAAAPDPAVGAYAMDDGPDVASELVIGADGHFSFAISAGAADYHAQGRWVRDGQAIRLTTEPKPVPPAFSAGKIGRTTDGPMLIVVRDPRGGPIAGIEFRIGMADGGTVEGYTQEEGWTVNSGKFGKPVWVELSLPMFNLAPQRFPLELSKGNLFEFTFTPNDLGAIDFRAEPFAVTATGLTQTTQGHSLQWVRAKQ
jgi:hypothetical protein